MEVVEFDQFWLGAGSRKLLRLASSSPEAACWGQPHRRHFTQPPLIGQEVDGAFGGKDTPAHLGGVCPDPALLHPRESCRHPAREDRIGLSLTELEVAAAQEEAALGELLLILAMRWTLDPIERRSEAFGWKWQTEKLEKETPP